MSGTTGAVLKPPFQGAGPRGPSRTKMPPPGWHSASAGSPWRQRGRRDQAREGLARHELERLGEEEVVQQARQLCDVVARQLCPG